MAKALRRVIKVSPSPSYYYFIKNTNSHPVITLPVISHTHKFIYFPIPKVANSSVRAFLGKQILCEDYLSLNDDLTYMHRLPFERIKIKDVEKYDDYFKFTFVRNPYSRIVSCYVDKILKEFDETGDIHFRAARRYYPDFYSKLRPGMSFYQFVKVISKIPDEYSDVHFISQHKLLSKDLKKANINNIPIDFYGRFEDFDHDFSRIFNYIGLKFRNTPHFKKRTYKKDYKFFYRQKTVELIKNRYKEDLKLFNYDFYGIKNSIYDLKYRCDVLQAYEPIIFYEKTGVRIV